MRHIWNKNICFKSKFYWLIDIYAYTNVWDFDSWTYIVVTVARCAAFYHYTTLETTESHTFFPLFFLLLDNFKSSCKFVFFFVQTANCALHWNVFNRSQMRHCPITNLEVPQEKGENIENLSKYLLMCWSLNVPQNRYRKCQSGSKPVPILLFNEIWHDRKIGFIFIAFSIRFDYSKPLGEQ